MKPEDKREWMRLLRGVIFAVSVSLSVLLLLFSFSRFVGNFSDGAVLVSVLGVLVTALVGWQIYTLINLNKIEERFKVADDKSHTDIAEVCGNLSDCFSADNSMIHAETLFAIHSLIHLSQIGNFEQCEREITALTNGHEETQPANTRLRAVFHRLTGRIAHPERISNFNELTTFIDSIF